jgi:hypothetical protein
MDVAYELLMSLEGGVSMKCKQAVDVIKKVT